MLMATNEYWIKREHENVQSIKQREKNYISNIENEYNQAIQAISDEILRDVNKYLESEKISMADFMQQADKMDVQTFNRKAAEYVKNKDFSSKVNTELKLYNLKIRVNRLQLLKAKIAFQLDQLGFKLEPNLQKYLQVEAMLEYQRQAGILGNSVNVNQSQIEKLVNGTHHNANWSTRLWTNMEDTRSIVNKALNSLLLQGINPNQFAAELKKLMNPLETSKMKAMRLLLTESANIQISVQLDSFQQTGFKEYEYVSEPRACSICQDLNGKIFTLNESQAGLNRSPMHPYCRCSTLPHESDGQMKDLLSKGYWKRREALKQREIEQAKRDRINYLNSKKNKS
ncbi:minor capsid protein [Carnobacterium divergens]|uniref:minor capsid protein n=1 Tax=Carnobacterium divergens TaxID=2748 RepID=UPI00288F944C|nr:minor capsid protein [Carnobacterium divergens]MDT1996848.1 minor capsid protein [Carnobacterium divergens]